MATRLNPYISFPGNAREAMEFYADVFGGKLDINTFGELGTQEPEQANKVMHAQFESNKGMTIMASDLAPGMEHIPGNNITISLSGDDQDELRGYWDKLSTGGNITMQLEKQVWGDEFGMCVDRFGVGWMVNIAQPQS